MEYEIIKNERGNSFEIFVKIKDESFYKYLKNTKKIAKGKEETKLVNFIGFNDTLQTIKVTSAIENKTDMSIDLMSLIKSVNDDYTKLSNSFN